MRVRARSPYDVERQVAAEDRHVRGKSIRRWGPLPERNTRCMRSLSEGETIC
ncbi:MAG: hypothetical protein KatS3mg109_1955 [Pirellulaceae bacterium]|nr:MAG: hypothetical protein KatS3mg109_1955 [Pirellulaceae bacterium]